MIKALFWEDSWGEGRCNSVEKREGYGSVSQGVNPWWWLLPCEPNSGASWVFSLRKPFIWGWIPLVLYDLSQFSGHLLKYFFLCSIQLGSIENMMIVRIGTLFSRL